MRPFWISFAEPPFGFERGIGVTAVDETDARLLALLEIDDETSIANVRWVRDAAELDKLHVMPNMGNLLRLGIWFPRGFEHLV